MERAVVLLSGGMDSTVCLAWAKRKFDEVRAIGFDYGQRHRVELEAAAGVARAAGVGFEVRQVGSMTGSALTDHSLELRDDGGHHDLPNAMTPGRNGIFLFHALNVAVPFGARHLVTGICLADDGGYPDCRESFRASIEAALGLAVEQPIRVHAPLMHVTKAETVRLATELDALALLALSHTCYEGRRPACGRCTACQARLSGFLEAGVDDPILYASSAA